MNWIKRILGLSRVYAVFVLGKDGSPTLEVSRDYHDLTELIESARDRDLTYWVTTVRV